MSETIEAEVIEIDGIVPAKPAGFDSRSGFDRGSLGRNVRMTLLNLNRKWWLLWLVLAVIFLATIGVVLGGCILVLSIIRGLFRILMRGLAGADARPGTLGRG